MSSNEPAAPAPVTEAAPKPRAPMSKPLVVFAVIAYVSFLVYSCTRALYAQCPSGETVSRGWQLSDALVACGVGGILAAVARGALNASDLPQDVKEKLDGLLTGLEDLKATEEATLAEIRERRASLWVAPDAPAGYRFPPGQEPAAAPEPEPEELLTSREVVLSTGHHVRVKVPKAAGAPRDE